MEAISGTTVSVWAATADTPSESRLSKDTSANVCVIGAGIAELTTAYLLAREGKMVIVLARCIIFQQCAYTSVVL